MARAPTGYVPNSLWGVAWLQRPRQTPQTKAPTALDYSQTDDSTLEALCRPHPHPCHQTIAISHPPPSKRNHGFEICPRVAASVKMGASDSKLVFKKGIFRLCGERNIPADDPYWTSVRPTRSRLLPSIPAALCR